MKTIALCMIVKNEQEYLRRCLNSVKDVVNQIVIVDTGSEDDTINIAKEYTNDVYHMDWTDDFSAARNESIKYATTDYILVLDADEYLEKSVDIQKEINIEADYYVTKIHNIMALGRATEHQAIRLFANHRGLFFRNRLHEHLNVIGEGQSYKSSLTDIKIIHSGYTEEIMEKRGKAKRNLSLMLAEVRDNPNGYNLFNMGKTYTLVGEHKKAIDFLQKAYSLSKNQLFAPELVMLLCRNLGELGKYQEALSILKGAVAVYPHEIDILHLQAQYYMECGYFKDAITTMNRCLELGDIGVSVTEGNGGYLAHYRLAEWYEARYQFAKSYEHIIASVKENDELVASLAKFFQIMSKVNIPIDDVYNSFKQIYKISSSDKLQRLLEVLYQLRHPLLERYLNEYNLTVQPEVRAVAYQYAKKYEIASSLWNDLDNLTHQNGEDILLLSILMNDRSLFDLSKTLLSLSKREWEVLKKIKEKKSLNDIKFTTNIEKILERMLVQLIHLQEFEIFEQILNYSWQGSIDTKLKVCDDLIAYSFNDIAIDLLTKLYEKYPENNRLLKMLGDTCVNLGLLDDANIFYKKLLDSVDDYSVFERIYEVYERLNVRILMNVIEKKISDRYPLCSWVNRS
ncbi:glycosyltransferase [Paenibacillus sp. FSL R5-0749]|uniref:glycosyltransferase n=1 Tax=Paenibacillus sp. FSL R5-0749 TaxID=2921657 RepID=UPI00315AD8FC